jgi:hypothetical protein
VTRSELDAQAGWQFAVRAAAVASVLVATLAVALYEFWGVNRVFLVAMAALIGLTVGLRLPPGAPELVRRRVSG